MIKNYLELSESEVDKLIEFINRKRENKLSSDQIRKEFESEKFDYGRGIITIMEGEEIVAKVSIILKECSKKGIAYVIDLLISDTVKEEEILAAKTLKEVKDIAQRYGAKEIYLGTRDERNIRILNALDLHKQYSAVRMTLEDREIRHLPLELITLSEDNKKEFLLIYNDVFGEIPNGATATQEEVDEYIKSADENNYYYITSLNGERIGILELHIEDGVGLFDLGLVKAVRGKGYGKQLLETAIDFLNSKNVPEASLIVITKNTVAYEMYKKRGFKETKLISDWFVID